MSFRDLKIKAIILSVLITVFGIFATSKIWSSNLVVFQHTVKFTLQFEKFENPKQWIEIFINSDQSPTFNESSKVPKEIAISTESQNYKIHIKRDLSDALHKIRIDLGNLNDIFILKNVSVNSLFLDSQNVSLHDLERIDKDKYRVTGIDPFIIFEQTFSKHPHPRVQEGSIPYFVSFIIFLFLVSYLICSRFESKVSNYSNVQFTLLSLLIVTLFIPGFRINYADVDAIENRKLAEFRPAIYSDYGINHNFTKDFDNWFADRFGYRNQLIELENLPKKFNKYPEAEKTFLGYNGMLFYKSEKDGNSVKYAAGLLPRTPISEILGRDNAREFLEKISPESEFGMIMAPAKSQVYPENYRILQNNKVVDYSEDLNILNRHIPFVHPLSVLNKYKSQGKVFWNHDTHWTPLGGCLAFSALASKMKIPFDESKCLAWKERTTGVREGDLDHMLPYGVKAPSGDHQFDNNEFADAVSKLKCHDFDRYIYCKNDSPLVNKNVIGLGDSQFYSTVFRQYVALAYKESFLIDRVYVKRDDPSIKNQIPFNIVDSDFIMEGAERYESSYPFYDGFNALNILLSL